MTRKREIHFLPTEHREECKEGESVFDVSRRAGIPIKTSCAGKGTCGLCRVILVEGEDHVSPINTVEIAHMGNVFYITKERLSCQLRLISDGTVKVRIKD